jgi:polyisoprenoid-binding protein YceI
MFRKTFALVATLGLCLAAIPAAQAATETYTIDPMHSGVTFKVRHLVGKVAGRFDTFSGTIVVDREDLTKSTVELTIDPASIDTDSEKRDTHLRSEDFFDVAKFPSIVFKGSKIAKTAENQYAVTGEFTMHGVTKTITVPVEVLGFGPSPWGKGGMAGFETNFTINRQDYGINWNKTLDAGGLMLGDDVEVSITIESGMKE